MMPARSWSIGGAASRRPARRLQRRIAGQTPPRGVGRGGKPGDDAGVDAGGLARARPRQTAAQACVRDQAARPRIVQHVGELVGLGQRVDRHEDGAGLERGEDRRPPVRRRCRGSSATRSPRAHAARLQAAARLRRTRSSSLRVGDALRRRRPAPTLSGQAAGRRLEERGAAASCVLRARAVLSAARPARHAASRERRVADWTNMLVQTSIVDRMPTKAMLSAKPMARPARHFSKSLRTAAGSKSPPRRCATR